MAANIWDDKPLIWLMPLLGTHCGTTQIVAESNIVQVSWGVVMLGTHYNNSPLVWFVLDDQNLQDVRAYHQVPIETTLEPYVKKHNLIKTHNLLICHVQYPSTKKH